MTKIYAMDIERLENTSFASAFGPVDGPVDAPPTLAFCQTYPVVCGAVTPLVTHFTGPLCGVSDLCATLECNTVSMCIFDTTATVVTNTVSGLPPPPTDFGIDLIDGVRSEIQTE